MRLSLIPVKFAPLPLSRLYIALPTPRRRKPGSSQSQFLDLLLSATQSYLFEKTEQKRRVRADCKLATLSSVALVHRLLRRRKVLDVLFDPLLPLLGKVVELEVALVLLRIDTTENQ